MAALQGLMERTMEQEREPVTSTPGETRSGAGHTCEWLRPGSADICSELSNQTLDRVGKDVFGYDSLRQGQEDAALGVLNGPILAVLRKRGDPALRRRLKNLLREDDVRNRDRMSVESVRRFTQPAVIKLLCSTGRVVYTIVPDLLRNPAEQTRDVSPHPKLPKVLPTKVYSVDDDKMDEDSDDECSQKDDSDDDNNLGNDADSPIMGEDGDGHFAKGLSDVMKAARGRRTKHLRDYVHIGRSAAKAKIVPDLLRNIVAVTPGPFGFYLALDFNPLTTKLPKILPTKVYAEDSDNECSQKDNSDDDSQTSDEETSTDFPKRVKDELDENDPPLRIRPVTTGDREEKTPDLRTVIPGTQVYRPPATGSSIYRRRQIMCIRILPFSNTSTQERGATTSTPHQDEANNDAEKKSEKWKLKTHVTGVLGLMPWLSALSEEDPAKYHAILRQVRNDRLTWQKKYNEREKEQQEREAKLRARAAEHNRVLKKKEQQQETQEDPGRVWRASQLHSQHRLRASHPPKPLKAKQLVAVAFNSWLYVVKLQWGGEFSEPSRPLEEEVDQKCVLEIDFPVEGGGGGEFSETSRPLEEEVDQKCVLEIDFPVEGGGGGEFSETSRPLEEEVDRKCVLEIDFPVEGGGGGEFSETSRPLEEEVDQKCVLEIDFPVESLREGKIRVNDHGDCSPTSRCRREEDYEPSRTILIGYSDFEHQLRSRTTVQASSMNGLAMRPQFVFKGTILQEKLQRPEGVATHWGPKRSSRLDTIKVTINTLPNSKGRNIFSMNIGAFAS
ncbi:hypothetical protein Bbelb_187100 [Branchiostoma belcheri]|nr:hypothetical protein Bbelb_187100 [Branchiostoma belcheri]